MSEALLRDMRFQLVASLSAIIAIVAERLGRGFEFDPVSLHAKDDSAAERFLYQSMRSPWNEEFLKV